MIVRRLEMAGLQVALLEPETPWQHLLYARMGLADGRETLGLAGEGGALICIEGEDWNRDLSPWPARRAFKGGEDFAGGGAEHLRTLLTEVLPAAEAALTHPPRHRGIMGYSLAGLFSLYAACMTDAFDFAASVSGSLWYDGFADFLAEREFYPRRAFLSLGDREDKCRDQRLRSVGACTARAQEILAQKGVTVPYLRTQGGHFVPTAPRMAQAVACFLQEQP